jgi:hypothetical protein
MRASTSALDAEDQDQEETPIPGAHNCPPARLFYRTFPSYVYTFFYYGCRRSERTLSYGVFRLNIGGNCPAAARASARNPHEGCGGTPDEAYFEDGSGFSDSADNETEKATTQQKHGAGLRRLRQGHRGSRSIVDEADRA